MPEKAQYCREQAALARSYADALEAGDELRAAFERASAGFLRLAEHYAESGQLIDAGAVVHLDAGLAKLITAGKAEIVERSGQLYKALE